MSRARAWRALGTMLSQISGVVLVLLVLVAVMGMAVTWPKIAGVLTLSIAIGCWFANIYENEDP